MIKLFSTTVVNGSYNATSLLAVKSRNNVANKKSSKIGLKTPDGHPCSWLYVISSTKRPSETKIGVAKLDLIERYKNLSTADPNLYVYRAFLVPSWYFGKTVRIEEIMWHEFLQSQNPSLRTETFLIRRSGFARLPQSAVQLDCQSIMVVNPNGLLSNRRQRLILCPNTFRLPNLVKQDLAI